MDQGIPPFRSGLRKAGSVTGAASCCYAALSVRLTLTAIANASWLAVLM